VEGATLSNIAIPSTGTVLQKTVTLKLNSGDHAQLIAELPGSEGSDVTLTFFGIWVAIPQGQSVEVFLSVPPDVEADR